MQLIFVYSYEDVRNEVAEARVIAATLGFSFLGKEVN